MTRDASGGIAPSLGAGELVRSVPGIERVAELEAISPMRLPGPSIPLEGLVELAAMLEQRLAGGLDGAVVIQGTDTIEETAWLLDLLVRSDKPVVVTGAMRGPEAAGADGPANLLAAASVAASASAAGLGTLVVLNDEIHAARFVRKSHTALPSAFSSPLCGPVGLLVEGRVAIYARLSRTPPIVPTAGVQAAQAAGAPPPVALLRMALGDDGRLLPALAGLGFRGAVIEGMGAGHVPAAVAPLVGELLAQMPVVLASRVPAGPTFTHTYGYPGAEIDLIARGVLPAGALGGPKARILLALLLASGVDRATLSAAFAAHSAA
jgi:L-asparaginase